MMKKIVVLMVVFALIFTFIGAGCRQSNSTTTTTTTTRATTTTTRAGTTTQATTTAATEPTEITYDNVITVSAFLKGNANVVWEGTDRQKEFEERFGIKIEAEFAWGADYNEKYNLMFAANNLPDYFSGLNTRDYLIAGDRGRWVNYLDHISQMPNVFRFIDKMMNSVAARTSEEGGIYGLYRVLDFSKTGDSTVAYSFFVRDDLLESGGFDLNRDLNNWDDFIRMLLILKEQMGDKPIMSGIGELMSIKELTLLANYMGTSADPLYWNYEDQVWEGSFYRENHKEYLKFLAWLYKTEMIHPDAGRHTQADMDVLGLAGDIAWMYTHGVYSDTYSKDSPANWVPVVPPAYRGKYWSAPNGTLSNFMLNQGSTINASTIDPEAIPRMIRFIDWLFSDEGVFLPFGEEGEDYIKIEGEEISDYAWFARQNYYEDELSEEHIKIAKTWADYTDNRPHMWSQLYIDDWIPYLDNWYVLAKQWSPSVERATEKLVKYYDNLEPRRIEMPPFMAPTLEYAEEKTDIIASVNTYIAEVITRIIIGQLDVDTEWASIISTLKTMKYDRLIEIENIAYKNTEGRLAEVEAIIKAAIAR